MSKMIYNRILILFTIFLGNIAIAQKVNEFPEKTDPLHVKVSMYDNDDNK